MLTEYNYYSDSVTRAVQTQPCTGSKEQGLPYSANDTINPPELVVFRNVVKGFVAHFKETISQYANTFGVLALKAKAPPTTANTIRAVKNIFAFFIKIYF